MAFGIPSAQELSATITQALDKAQAAGAQLETQAAQEIHTQLHTSLTELFEDAAPIVEQFHRLNETLERAAELLERLDGASVTLKLGTIAQGKAGTP